MVGIPIEEIKITHEELCNQLIKQLTTMTLDLSVAKAENEKMKQYIHKLLTNNVTNDQE